MWDRSVRICVITNKTNKRLWKTSYSKYISNTLKYLFELSRKLKQLEIVPCSIDDMQLNECDLIHIPNLGRGSYPRKKYYLISYSNHVFHAFQS